MEWDPLDTPMTRQQLETESWTDGVVFFVFGFFLERQTVCYTNTGVDLQVVW